MVAKFLEATKALGWDVEVIVKDSQSNPNRAAEVAKELISRDEVQPDSGGLDAGNHQPGLHRGRGRGNAGDFIRGTLAAVVHRPAGQPG